MSTVHGTNENGPCDCGDAANCAEEREPLTKERFMEIHGIAAPADGLRGQLESAIADAHWAARADETILRRLADAVMAVVEPRLEAEAAYARQVEGDAIDLAERLDESAEQTRIERERAERAEKRVAYWIERADEYQKLYLELTGGEAR
jgi:hypothetical protein